MGILGLSFISKLIEKGIINKYQARLLEGTVYTLALGLLSYVYQCLSTGDRTQWKATLLVLFIGFAKSFIETIMKIMRDNQKQKDQILEIVNPTEGTATPA